MCPPTKPKRGSALNAHFGDVTYHTRMYRGPLDLTLGDHPETPSPEQPP